MKDDGREEKRLSHVYSEEQVHAAVSFYTEHGKSLSKTVESLGYPHRTRTLKGWIEKLAKEELVQRDYGDTQKRYCTEDVAKALCSSQVRGGNLCGGDSKEAWCIPRFHIPHEDKAER